MPDGLDPYGGLFNLAGGSNQAALALQAASQAALMEQIRTQTGLGLLTYLTDLQRDPFNLVGALTAANIGGGGPGAAANIIRATDQRGLPLSRIDPESAQLLGFGGNLGGSIVENLARFIGVPLQGQEQPTPTPAPAPTPGGQPLSIQAAIELQKAAGLIPGQTGSPIIAQDLLRKSAGLP